MRLFNWLACRAGRPRCYRKIKNGIDFAMCKSCHRQSEIHEFGGPNPREVQRQP